MKKLLFFLLLFLAISCQKKRDDFTQFVDPFIGTGGHGHTFPGATTPFGMVQLSPDTRKDNWDACSGYHYSDHTILGFSHTHLSGTGVGDYGDIRFMPMTGGMWLTPGEESDPETGYRSRFSHSNETAAPGYYQVFLEDYKINVELTTTKRCGFHQYTFPDQIPANVVIDLSESVTSDEILESSIDIINDHEIKGFRRTKGWAADQRVYFYAQFSEPFFNSGIATSDIPDSTLKSASGDNLKAFVSFSKRDWKVLKVKVGISPVSTEGARKNLEQEIPGWNFDKIARENSAKWNSELSKIEVRSENRSDEIKFYTALYHCFICPNIFMDVDGSYRGHDGKIYNAGDHEIYTVFSLWDTYRAFHPLMTILQPEKTEEFIHTMLDIYDKGGLLPVWELAGNETFCMIGYHSVPVIVDAAMKGYSGFDMVHAFEAMKHSANVDFFGLKAYRENGYIPADDEGESVSKTLEYAYDDWCIAQMARLLGREEDYNEFIKRAQNYKNLFDPVTGFIRGKKNSSFVEPFDPAEVNLMLTEANTWQYTFYVPQDIDGLMNLLGGKDEFAAKLDKLFSTSSELTGRDQSDITGLIGQYAHGNEPSHHMAYLYEFAGQPYKTQEIVRKIMGELYKTGPDGLCGNEDCGQMSAWLVMSALGFYPVTPCSNQYIIGSPLFDEAILHLPDGKKFSIKAEKNSSDNIYIQSATFNGKVFKQSYFTHEELMNGGELNFKMGSRPSATWATKREDLPKSIIKDQLITPVPFFNEDEKTFRDEIKVAVNDAYPGTDIYYNLNNSIPDKHSNLYSDTIISNRSFRIIAVAESDSMIPSIPARAVYNKLKHNWDIWIKNTYSREYSAGGDLALIDDNLGGTNFRTGGWQGYHGVDFEAVIDLRKKQAVNTIVARFLSDQRSWIFLPESVEISISDKPYDYKVISLINNPVTEDNVPSIHEFKGQKVHAMARYIRVRAKNIGTCPSWHAGSGNPAWLFIDEIKVE